MSEELKPKKVSAEVEELRGLVEGLTEKVAAMNAPRPGSLVRKRVKEHVCTLREVKKDDKLIGIATRLFNVREVKDPIEARRFRGLCDVEWINPQTKEAGTLRDVDYLQFLDLAERVTAKILNWKREKRFEVDPRKGGGGVGALYKQGPNNEYLVDAEYEFEVAFEDHTFTLEITSGEFMGAIFENDGKGVNI